MNKLVRQFTGFSIVGIFVSLFSIGLLWLLTDILTVNVYISYTVAYLISIGVSYLINGRLIFRSVLGLRTYLLYYGIYLSGMGLGLIIIAVVKYLFTFGEFANAVCAAPFTMIWNFILVRWLFAGYQIKDQN